MKLTRLQIYLTAWLLYLAFIFSLYSHFQITVMLFSIPLAMLGGWLYRYRGALVTILISICAHFGLLSIYAGDPTLVFEAFNPFGIGSQLIFSSCAALLKTTQVKYHQLNNSLQEIVAERTKDLEQLTAYLIDVQLKENNELSSSLLEKPYQELKSMLATSQLLKQKLSAKTHARTSDAEHISLIIKACIEQLRAIENHSITNVPVTDNITDSIRILKKRIDQVSNVDIQFLENPEWGRISKNLTQPLCEIIFEAVANALRHADPDHISIGIEKNARQTAIFIENDGKPLKKNFIEGMGIPLMRYRAGKIGATLSLKPLSSKSTRLTCTIPSGT